jgi:prevent-host-death family protein
MTIMSVGELKPRFSDVMQKVRKGHEVVISFGRKKEKVAMIIPYAKSHVGRSRIRSEGKIKHDLDSFIGTWVEDPNFDKVIASFETVDREMWK